MAVGRGHKIAAAVVAVLWVIPQGAAAAGAAVPNVPGAIIRSHPKPPPVNSMSAAEADRYPNGRIPAAALCLIEQGGHRLRCDAAGEFVQLSKAFEGKFGHRLTVTDSYRSYEGQVSCRARKGYLCAVPGTSNHGRGLAVDLAGAAHLCGTREHQWLERNAGKYGWLWPGWARPTGSKTECWHWQYRTDN